MSDIFKYAQYADGNADPAQEFLKKKMSNTSSSYTQEQIERLMQTGGPAVVGAQKDVKLSSDFYNNQNPTKGKSSGSSSSSKLKGTMSAQQIREEFGLSYDGEKEYDGGTHKGRLQNEAGDIWYKENGEIKYLGNVNDSEYKRGRVGQGSNKKSKSSSDIGRFFKGDDKRDGGHHKSTNSKLQSALDEYSYARNDFDNGFNSINDVGNAMRHLMDGNEPAKEEEPNKPIEYSPEIKQAINRVKSYEDDVMSGKISEEIYDGFSRNRDDSIDNEATDNVFDINDGQTGIGTEGSLANSDGSFESTQNFLQSKKLDVLKKYQFKPV